MVPCRTIFSVVGFLVAWDGFILSHYLTPILQPILFTLIVILRITIKEKFAPHLFVILLLPRTYTRINSDEAYHFNSHWFNYNGFCELKMFRHKISHMVTMTNQGDWGPLSESPRKSRNIYWRWKWTTGKENLTQGNRRQDVTTQSRKHTARK